MDKSLKRYRADIVSMKYGVEWTRVDVAFFANMKRAGLVWDEALGDWIVAQPTPNDAIKHCLSEVLTQMETHGDWDDGCQLRVVIIEAFGLAGLQTIEQHAVESKPVVDAPGRDPWRVAKEAYRRKREIRATMRGKYTPPWRN